MTKAEMKELVARDTARAVAAERAKVKPLVRPYVEQLRQHGLTEPEQGMDAIMARFEDNPEVQKAMQIIGVHELVGEVWPKRSSPEKSSSAASPRMEPAYARKARPTGPNSTRPRPKGSIRLQKPPTGQSAPPQPAPHWTEDRWRSKKFQIFFG